MHILIAPDKFKGSLTATQAAEAMHRGMKKVWPGASFVCIPVADGGEGTMQAFHAALGGAWLETMVHDARGRRVPARLLMTHRPDGRKLAVVETSEACGYLRIAPDERDLLHSSTFGVGTLLLAARDAGADEIIAGLGGSATNDGGLGMAAALGYRFLDAKGKALEALPVHFHAIQNIAPPAALRLPPITIAGDVANPLLGTRGATAVYGPQKGLKPEEFQALESGLAHYAALVETLTGQDLRAVPGAGAAGGLGFGLMAFGKATLRPGFEIIAEITQLMAQVERSDLVVTGEGSLDAQTLEGKTAAGVARLARKAGRPVVALAGRVTDEDQLDALFDAWSGVAPAPMPLDEAIKNADQLLERAAVRLAATLHTGRRLP
jgi:glycerate kinase